MKKTEQLKITPHDMLVIACIRLINVYITSGQHQTERYSHICHVRTVALPG